MAESITYADLRFVKSPLKKSLSARLEQDAEVDDDGELTYENVQVPSAKDVFSSPAQPGLGQQTGGAKTEKPVTTLFSEMSPTPRRILPCPVAWIPYILLSLLGTCLLLGVTSISLGIRYMQVSHQLRNTNQVLEVTNGSLRQQLQMETYKLSSKEDDLQATEEKLAQTQQNLQVEKEQHQDTQKNLQTCRSEQDKTQQNLKDEMEDRRRLEEKLRTLQDGLKQVQSLFTCSFQGSDQEWVQTHSFPRYCCPLEWKLSQRKCLYISRSVKTWMESNSFCKSLSSNLLEVAGGKKHFIEDIPTREQLYGSFWVQKKYETGSYRCPILKKSSSTESYEFCEKSHPFICEKEAVTYPAEWRDHLLH
ncbi:B-cell differentiation antigen CD72 [Gracilinanus agilis]|uniref:B-cell differentiation antigen CD72 n=1 Tax=Gracilinanus agilis TaxID=191870 RepID=UPI001CFEA997|nr:B-cell differentiation antigen CD72 [Gracilinanus agilis]